MFSECPTALALELEQFIMKVAISHGITIQREIDLLLAQVSSAFPQTDDELTT